ncbi:hypothetical protein [Angustibacter luteus]|uniref:DUF3618 domain-containing protein n=1 Tax=Angustibacter luteus TaxID=658456 RepID=A0ABW1JGA2_9ACTN
MTESPRYDPAPTDGAVPPPSTFPYANGFADGSTSPSTDGTTNGSSTDVAKDKAADVKDSATEATATVAGTVKDQTGQVVGEAKSQARDLLSQGRAELTDQASTQQQRAAGSLHALSTQLHDMSASASQPGLAQDLTGQVADHAASIASWLEDREPGAVLDEVRDYARRRPGTFLALCAGAGVLAGRLARGVQADASAEPVEDPSSADGKGTSELPGTAPSPDGPLATPAATAAADDWAAHDVAPAGHL